MGATAAAAGLCFCLFAAACGGELEPDPPIPELDETVFADVVQPVLAARCGNPTSCHGREDRPLALYVRRANRARAEDVFLDPPLTADELRANFERSRSFAVDRGSGPELLTKPLAERISGVWHRGADIFESTEDREYRDIESWIAHPGNRRWP